MQLESFLEPMLNLNPDKRATAQAMLTHEWLDGVIVQGASLASSDSSVFLC